LFGFSKNNVLQVAYQIMLGTNLKQLKIDKADCWDSGKTERLPWKYWETSFTARNSPLPI